MSANESCTVIACPHKGISCNIFEGEMRRENTIRVHATEIGALAINPDCTLIASASIKGTVIRITSVETGDML